jgi:hypothetical protein
MKENIWAYYVGPTSNTRFRLRELNRIGEAFALKHPRCPEEMLPRTWRDVRKTTLKDWESYYGRGLTACPQGWYTSRNDYFRGAVFVDKWKAHYAESGYVPRIDHSGYYCDAHEDEVLRGCVARLTHGRFIAGYCRMPARGRDAKPDETVWYGKVYDDLEEAIRDADHYAERVAEEWREAAEEEEEEEELEE